MDNFTLIFSLHAVFQLLCVSECFHVDIFLYCGICFSIISAQEDEGLLACVLYAGYSTTSSWQGLCYTQDKFVRLLREKFRAPVRSLEHRPFGITEADVLTYDEDALIEQLHLYIEPDDIPHFTDDIHSLVGQAVYSSGLWGRPSLSKKTDHSPLDLPVYVFDEDEKTSALAQLPDRFQQYNEIHPDVLSALEQAVRQDPTFSPSCTAYLSLLAVEVSKRPDVAIPLRLDALSSRLPRMLTPEQQRGT